jgi:hypothetical protein
MQVSRAFDTQGFLGRTVADAVQREIPCPRRKRSKTACPRWRTVIALHNVVHPHCLWYNFIIPHNRDVTTRQDHCRCMWYTSWVERAELIASNSVPPLMPRIGIWPAPPRESVPHPDANSNSVSMVKLRQRISPSRAP